MFTKRCLLLAIIASFGVATAGPISGTYLNDVGDFGATSLLRTLTLTNGTYTLSAGMADVTLGNPAFAQVLGPGAFGPASGTITVTLPNGYLGINGGALTVVGTGTVTLNYVMSGGTIPSGNPLSGQPFEITSGTVNIPLSSGSWVQAFSAAGTYDLQFNTLQATNRLSASFTETPEPATFAMIGLGAAAGLAASRRRRNNR